MIRLALLVVTAALALASGACGDPSCPAGYVLNATKTLCVPIDAGVDAGGDSGAPDACTPVAETCNGRDDDCDGVVDGPAAGTACGVAAVNESASACTAGSCAYTCTHGYLDCTTAPGCETHTDIDSSNCGSCGHTCAWGQCTAGVCNDAIQIAAGGDHVCALRQDGTVVCWGRNDDGQLGDETTTARNHPALVHSLIGVVRVDVGSALSVAVLTDGSLHAWGTNFVGMLGDGGSETFSPVATVITGVTHVRESGIGDQSTCARDASGQVWAWGDGSYGQAGDGFASNHLTPHASHTSGAVQIASGGAAVCALTASGTAECWGDGRYGQLGDGSSVHDSCGGDDCALDATTVSGLTAVEVCVGGNHACARLADGTVECWGTNGFGQLGDGMTVHSSACAFGDCALAPVHVSGITGTTAISCGGASTCALRGDGGVVCWGDNASGQLGDGMLTGHDACGAVDCARTPVVVTDLTDAVEISVGYSHACARRATGAVVCWGADSYGQLGDALAVHASCVASDCIGSPVTVAAP